MGLFSSMFSSGVSEVVDSVADGLDTLFTSDEERLKAKNMLEQIKANAKLKDKELETKSVSALGKQYYLQADYDNAVACFDKLLEIGRRKEDFVPFYLG